MPTNRILAWLRYGQDVEFTTEAYPGEVFKGRIAFIDPVLNEDTRTVKVRVNVPNDDGRLKPEMFVRAIVKSHIAAGGRVLDASLAGKWISPMHPGNRQRQTGRLRHLRNAVGASRIAGLRDGGTVGRREAVGCAGDGRVADGHASDRLRADSRRGPAQLTKVARL